MATPIPETTRQLVKDLHAKGHSRNAIAKEAGVSAGTVTNICRAAGLDFDRTATRAAVAARVIDLKDRRQQIMADLMGDAEKLRKQLWEPARLVNFGGKDNTLNETTLNEPLFVDKKNIMSAVGIALDRVVKLEAIDATTTGPTTAAESVVDKLMAGFIEAYEAGK